MFREVEDLFRSEGPSNGLNSRGKYVRNCIEPDYKLMIDPVSSAVTSLFVSYSNMQKPYRKLTTTTSGMFSSEWCLFIWTNC